MGEQREKFEEWFFANIDANTFVEDLCWQAWCAAIESVAVKLPVTVCRTHVFEIPFTNEVGMEHSEYFEVDEIHKRLKNAGIKYE